MGFISNIVSFASENWSAALIFVAVTTVEFVVWWLQTRRTEKTTAHLQRDAQDFNRTLEDHKYVLERQNQAISEAFDAQSHVREIVADKMVEDNEVLCIRASVLCDMAAPCIAVGAALEPGARDGSSCLKVFGWDNATNLSFDANVRELL